MTFALLFQRETMSFAGMLFCHNYNTLRLRNSTYRQQISELTRTYPAQSDYASLRHPRCDMSANVRYLQSGTTEHVHL
jgi:hypothetical protein